MNTTEDVFVREVDDELRRDELLGFWQRWGKPLLGAVAIFLVGWGGWLYWQHRQTEAAGRAGEEMTAAIESLQGGNMAAGEQKLAEIAKSGRPGYRAMAELTQGGVAIQKGDDKTAIDKFSAVANDKDAPKAFRDLATIRLVATRFDAMKPDEAIARLKPYTVPGNPWYGSAGEMSAIAYLRLGNKTMAAGIFSGLAKDEKVPESIRSRAIQMANALGSDVSAPAPKEGLK